MPSLCSQTYSSTSSSRPSLYSGLVSDHPDSPSDLISPTYKNCLQKLLLFPIPKPMIEAPSFLAEDTSYPIAQTILWFPRSAALRIQPNSHPLYLSSPLLPGPPRVSHMFFHCLEHSSSCPVHLVNSYLRHQLK